MMATGLAHGLRFMLHTRRSGAFGSFAQDTTSQGAFSWRRHLRDRRYRCLIESSGSCHEQLLPPFAHKHQHFHIHNLVASNSTEYLVNSIDCNLLRLSCTRNCHRGSQAQASPTSTADFIRQAVSHGLDFISRTGHLPNATLYDRSELTPVN